MADIKQYTDQIQNAVYGEEVRSSIINALNKVNDDNESYQDIKNQINQAKDHVDEKIADFGDMVTEAQSAKTALETVITNAKTAQSNLSGVIVTANAMKTSVSNASLEAYTARTELKTIITEANTATSNAETAKTNLDASVTTANTSKSNLETVISNANTAKTNLDTSTSTGQTVKTNLDTAIENATTSKGQLETVITNAETAQSNLLGVIVTANQSITTLETDISTGNALAFSLDTKNSTAVQNINDLTDANFNAREILTGVEDIKAYLGYVDEDIVGLQVDFENKTFTRLAGAVGKSAGADFDSYPMYGGRRRCNVADDGTINAYYGDDNFDIHGSNGQVMVYQPAFYYKVVPLKLDKNTDTGIGYHIRKANYYVSATPHTGFKLHPAFYDVNGNPVDYILFSAFEGAMQRAATGGYVNDGTNTSTDMDLTADLICSVAGVKPISGLYKNLTRANFEKLASNRGVGWHGDTVKSVSANQLLIMIELGTMNAQAAIGQGIVSIAGDTSYNCASLTGYTSALGNDTGQATTTRNEINGVTTDYTESGKVAVTYRGIENPWGNIWKLVNGVNIWGDGTMGGGQPYIADDFNFAESTHSGNYKPVGFTLPIESSYINALGYGSEEYDWLLMPSEIGGTSSLPIGDYVHVVSNLNAYRTAEIGATWVQHAAAGAFAWHHTFAGSTHSYNAGGRLLYVPTATV